MPIPGARYRVKQTPKGPVRLAFKGKGKVVEAKNLKTGDTHTPTEFAMDAKHKKEKMVDLRNMPHAPMMPAKGKAIKKRK